MKPSGQSNHHSAPGRGRHAPATKGASGGGRRSKNNLVALGSAAVLAIYAAGYVRTRGAAQRLAEPEHRRPASPDRVAKLPAAQPSAPAPADPAVKSPELSGEVVPPPATTAVTTTPPAPVPVALSPITPAASSAPAPVAPLPPSPPAVVAVSPAPVAVPTPVTTTAAPASLAATVAPPSTSFAGNVSSSATSAPVAAAQPVAKWKDGTYRAWGHCRHGDLEATVEIKGGRIYSTSISQCLTRYSCDVIDVLPGQAVARQSAEVDIVTGSTQSSDAFYDALVAALKQAAL